jgi:bifunctional DNA-binding transcriptional regulator/antitoxin component of YhaV-PrlF toxin-antitoxin module
MIGLTLCFMSAAYPGDAKSGAEHTHLQLLLGDRVLIGTVQEVRGAQARIDTGEIQPRFVPMGVREAKGLPDLKRGDRVEITVNDQNLLVDVHLIGEASYHRVVEGQLIQPLVTGHVSAIFRTTQGKEESHFIRPVARSKMASVPVGVDAVFLIDESDRIVDVTFGSKEAVHRAAELWEKKTPLKGNFDRITGVIETPLANNVIAVGTDEGRRTYEVRPLAQRRLLHLSKGDAVVLLVDEDNKVTDVAIPPGSNDATPITIKRSEN